ncbi:MAG: hypothetical protein O2960_19535 [Verrucomicrobia bacterium]|nr:hypothetical protein [Verrucomicrobiota bacterium]
MSLSGNRTRLATITRELSNNWLRTKEQWKDAKSKEFEHDYMDELFACVDKAGPVIEQLDKLVTRIRKECE